MNLVGLDLNATRVRAVNGPPGAPARTVALDGARGELPLALSLEKRRPEVGRAGLALCRRLPHLACLDFLPFLGEPRQWIVGRRRLDAAHALGLVFDRLSPLCKGTMGAWLTVPSYLTGIQVDLLGKIAKKAKLTVLGTAVTPLVAALAAHAERPWNDRAVVVDVDGHALTWTAVAAGEEQVFILGECALPGLNLHVWKNRLVDVLADRCIRQSRRDPRESALAEQMLYDQLDAVLDANWQGQPTEVEIRAASWFQNVLLRPEDLAGACAALVRQSADGLTALLPVQGFTENVVVTEAAGRLPGLVPALQDWVGERAAVSVLPPNAVVRAVHALGARCYRGELAPTHLDTAAALLRKHPRPEPRKRRARALQDAEYAKADEDFSIITEE